MTQHTQTPSMPSPLWQYWRGLSGWNFYFLVKFGLLWAGYLNFHPLLNLVFMAFLLMPIPKYRLHRLRHWIAIPVGFALFWHDTWLPGPVFTLWPAGQPTDTVTTTGGNAAATVATAGDKPVIGDMPAQTAPPTTANLNAWLNTFYAAEEKRKTTFPAQLPPDAQPFDLLVINICSLSWSDVEAAGLMSHPLWSHFDILFKHFNSGTSYSGPAAIRLLRASCGQPSHTRLYQPANNECYLFDNLAKLGFTQHLMMDHNGEFGGFLKEVRENGGMQSELMN